jgi:PAS domain S-box-containing protein
MLAAHQRIHRARLRHILIWLLPINLGFALLEGIAFLLHPDAAMGIALAVTLSYSWCLLLARTQVRLGQLKVAITMICAGFLGADLFFVFVWPALLPALVLLPVLSVIIALPYIDSRPLRFLIITCWLVTVAIALVGEFIAPRAPMSLWLTSVFRVGTLATVVALVLLLLRRFSQRLTQMLAQTQTANVALQVTQARLEAQNERLSVTLQSIGDGVITTDPVGRIALINNIAEHITGWAQAEVAGKPFAEIFRLLSDQPRELIANPVENVLRNGALLRPGEHTLLLTRDGRERIIADSAAPIRNLAGQIIGVVFVFRDITERKRAEDEHRSLERKLLETQKLESLGVLAGGVAHDFNNLLAAILGNAGLALCDLPPDSPARESLRQIESASRRAAELTQQMLAYAGKGLFVMQRLDLNLLIEDMLYLVKASIAKTPSIDYRLAPHLPAIEADATLMRQLMMNLITNAAEAIGDQNGSILVASGVRYADAQYLATTHLAPNIPPGYYVYLEVSDTGSGMDAETLVKIFDPFFTTKFTGRGLGLAAVLGIVRSHGGAVKVVSRPASGTTFTILLPCASAAAEPLPLARPAPFAWRMGGTVLVIDDEELVRLMVAQLLERLGFTVLVAGDGQAGVEVFRTHADVIGCTLLDMTMPQLNGEQTFRALRLIKSDARVVLMSGYDEQELSSRFAGQGLAGFLHKPFSPADLRDKLQQALNQD